MPADLEMALRRFAEEQDRLAPAVSAEEALARASNPTRRLPSGPLAGDDRLALGQSFNAPDAARQVDHRKRRSPRLLFLAGLAVLVVAVSVIAVALLTPSKTRVTATPPSTVARPGAADANETAARAEAARIAGLAHAGPQWAEVSAAPSAILDQPAQAPLTPNLIDVSRFWIVPGSWTDVRGWISAHPLSTGVASGGHGSSSGPGGPTSYYDVYTLGSIENVFKFRTIVVATAPTADGRVGVRLDAQVVWLPTRPTAETVPSVAASATVSAYRGTPDKAIATRTFSDGPTVSRLAATVNALSLAVPGQHGCLADNGLRLVVTFAAPPPAKTVVVTSNPACGESGFSVGGIDEPLLQTGGLTDQEAALLGTSMQSLSAT